MRIARKTKPTSIKPKAIGKVPAAGLNGNRHVNGLANGAAAHA
jgi:hypothetical protein